MSKLNESSELYSGIFWIKDPDNPTNELFFPIPTDEYGNNSGLFNSRNGLTYNHENTWKELHINKPFDYYPRGRVDIQNSVARIFLNPNLNTEKVIDFIKKEFNLNEMNGIKKIVVKPDFSIHYRCHLDN